MKDTFTQIMIASPQLEVHDRFLQGPHCVISKVHFSEGEMNQKMVETRLYTVPESGGTHETHASYYFEESMELFLIISGRVTLQYQLKDGTDTELVLESNGRLELFPEQTRRFRIHPGTVLQVTRIGPIADKAKFCNHHPGFRGLDDGSESLR